MKLTKLCSLIAAACIAGLAHNASAQDRHWTGNGNDGMWANPANWDLGVPTTTTYGIFIDPQVGGSVVTIAPGETENPGTVGNTHAPFGMIFGPEFGAGLNIYGTLHYDWYLAPVALAGNPSVINMYGNASLSGEGIGLGYNWFYNGAPYVTMNVYDNASVNINFLFWGGHLNLSGGTFTTGGVADGDSDQVSDATRLMNITGGHLIMPGDATATVNGWIGRGILQAYGGAGQINIDTVSLPGQTIISAVPEPASLALFGLCGIGGLWLRRRRSNA